VKSLPRIDQDDSGLSLNLRKADPLLILGTGHTQACPNLLSASSTLMDGQIQQDVRKLLLDLSIEASGNKIIPTYKELEKSWMFDPTTARHGTVKRKAAKTAGLSL
jgi:hypothetical protein